MSRKDLKAEVITFSAATLDGVAAFTCPFIDNMIQHRDVRARVIAEIDAAESTNRLTHPVATYDETNRLPYFMACINETLRRDAPAQTILPRLVSEGGYEIDIDAGDGGGQYRYYIPEGTQMGASPFIIHRDESIFGPEPEEFRPERWLSSPPSQTCPSPRVSRMEKYGMWWGYGDRECAGKYYAQMEMQKLCLELLRRFDFGFESNPADAASSEDRNRDRDRERFVHKRWAVGMFWDFRLLFRDRVQKEIE